MSATPLHDHHSANTIPPSITATKLPTAPFSNLVQNGNTNGYKYVSGGLAGAMAIILGGGVTIFATKDDVRDITLRHAQEEHSQIKDLEGKIKELEIKYSRYTESQERMGKHIYIHALQLDYTIDYFRWINGGKLGPEPEYPEEIKRLRYEVNK